MRNVSIFVLVCFFSSISFSNQEIDRFLNRTSLLIGRCNRCQSLLHVWQRTLVTVSANQIQIGQFRINEGSAALAIPVARLRDQLEQAVGEADNAALIERAQRAFQRLLQAQSTLSEEINGAVVTLALLNRIQFLAAEVERLQSTANQNVVRRSVTSIGSL